MSATVLVKNMSGEDIPPYAVMLVTGVERLPNNRIALKVDKFTTDRDSDAPPNLLVNTGTTIRISGAEQYGHGTIPDAEPIWVRFDGSSSPPTFGQQWGLEDDEWDLKSDSDESPFTIIGLADFEAERVLATFVQEGGEPCPNAFRIIVVGNPTTGTFDLTLELPDGSDTLTLNWDDTAAEVQTAIESHAHWSSDYDVETADGPFPTNSISIQFGGGLSGEHIDAPTVDNITLSGGARSGVRVERACCEEAI